MPHTIVVTGASGLLGRAVYEAFAARPEFHVVGTAFSRAGKHASLDLTDAAALESFLATTRPALVVHCAAERRPDVAARDEAGTLRLNVNASGTLSRLAAQAGAKLVYISTDYVFDGTSPPYEVDAAPNPLNFYGKSKLAGEQAVLEADPHAAVLRVPVLYGVVDNNGDSAVNILIDIVKASPPPPISLAARLRADRAASQDSSKQTKMDHFQSRFPTCVEDVAKALVGLADKHFGGVSVEGVFHFSAKERMTKYDMCKVLGELLNAPISHLIPETEAPKDPIATRPNDAQLSTARIESIGVKIECVPFRTWFAQHLG
nr:Methionine adenosyltransferase 2 subunit beta [Polyrhizophydium stewartii]